MAEIEAPQQHDHCPGYGLPNMSSMLESRLGRTDYSERNTTASERTEHDDQAKRRFHPMRSSRLHRRAVSKQQKCLRRSDGERLVTAYNLLLQSKPSTLSGVVESRS